jgi:hypothetical protein
MRKASWRAVAGLLLAAALLAPVRAVEAPGSGLAAAEDKLAALNTLARAHYAAAKAATLATLGPIIVVEPDALTLLRDGAMLREVYVPARYRDLKALSHAALGLYSLLAPHAGRTDFASWRGDLATYRAKVAEIASSVNDLGLHWDDARRQREMLKETLALMDRTLAEGYVSSDTLRAYADEVGPSLLGNLYDASDAELKSLDALVTRWRAEMGPAEWARLYVVVLGPSRPRERLPPYEYFARVLGKEAAEEHLIRADNIGDVAGGLDLLATTVTDRGLAADFFRDPGRVEAGLMKDSTDRHLEQIFGKETTAQ